MEIDIEIPGNPIALKRARHGNGKVFDSQAEERKGIRWLLKSKADGEPPDQPTIVKCEFHIVIPRSWSKRKRLALESTPHTSAPDVDNLVKWIFDVGNGILWKDDRTIYEVQASKFWACKPKTILSVLYC